jgi:deoxyadenosine/deoxycytidine kinase
MDDADRPEPRIVVAGPCAAGKTTLVNNLSPLGYNIHSCAQEHSFAPKMWQRSNPEWLIFLDAELETIAERQKRGDWTQARLNEQRKRLAHARSHCDLYLKTDDLTRKQVADAVVAFLRQQGVDPKGGQGREDSGPALAGPDLPHNPS